MKSMCATFLAFLALLAAGPANADERILAYDSVIELRVDGSLDVTETIRIRAEGDRINRGIYRDFPTRYRDRHGNNVVVDLEVVGVERNGQPEPWFTEGLGNGVRINTGNDDFIERPAEHVFTLRYRTTRQLGFFADNDELYWNAIGTGWEFPIDAGSVEVRLPAPVPVADMHAEGYTGAQGAQGQAYEVSLPAPGVARWRLTAPLSAQEGFTTVVTFPKGLVTEPTSSERAGWFLKDNRGVLVALAGLAVLLTYCVRRWRAIGRDPHKGVIIARYEPPEGRSPADLRYMKRMGYDTRCFTADVLALSVAGFLRIHRDKRMLGADTWKIERLEQPSSPPSASQTALLNSLFAGNSKATLILAKTNAARLQTAQTAHTESLDGQFQPEYFRRNGGSIGIAVLIAVAVAVLAFFTSGGGGILAIIGVIVLMVIVLIVFGILIKAPTVQGRRLLDEIEGLKLYLGVAERDELKRMEGPDAPPVLDAQRYEHLLPYAVALDVEDAWTDKFTLAVGAAAATAATAGMAWYHGGGGDSLGSLTQAVSNSFSSAISSASTPPGSSSGSGGGGSSGGGGGGGGGGGR